jgi:hypothetical protein
MNTKIVGTAVIALVVGFGAGYFAHSSSGTTGGYAAGMGRTGGAGFTGARGGMAGGGGFLAGTVAAEDSGSITLDTRDGSSHVVLLTPATTVSKSVTGTLSDVSVGSTIIVSGTTNSDGSVSASLIQLRPATMGSTTPN